MRAIEHKMLLTITRQIIKPVVEVSQPDYNRGDSPLSGIVPEAVTITRISTSVTLAIQMPSCEATFFFLFFFFGTQSVAAGAKVQGVRIPKEGTYVLWRLEPIYITLGDVYKNQSGVCE